VDLRMGEAERTVGDHIEAAGFEVGQDLSGVTRGNQLDRPCQAGLEVGDERPKARRQLFA
jgi:hypothetical protein